MGIVCANPARLLTTVSKSRDPSHVLPIEFIFANLKARDMVHESRVNHAITLSGHYPVEIQIVIPTYRFWVTR